MKTQKNPITAFFTSREGYLAIFVAILFVVLYFTTNLRSISLRVQSLD